MSLIKAAATERLESMLQAPPVRLRTVRGVNLIEIDRDPEIGFGSRWMEFGFYTQWPGIAAQLYCNRQFKPLSPLGAISKNRPA
jgi:hypothetical protein